MNLGRIRELSLLERETSPEPLPAFRTETLVMELTDERNALERCMLHFSNLEKETLKLDDSRYRVTLRYDKDDETEILIRVLSFGPVLRVLEPQHFVGLIKDRISKQLALGRKE